MAIGPLHNEKGGLSAALLDFIAIDDRARLDQATS
jgi:hypothetical protein